MKELFVSSMVRWVGGTANGGFGAIIFDQLHLLREQMHSEIAGGTVVSAPFALSRGDGVADVPGES